MFWLMILLGLHHYRYIHDSLIVCLFFEVGWGTGGEGLEYFFTEISEVLIYVMFTDNNFTHLFCAVCLLMTIFLVVVCFLMVLYPSVVKCLTLGSFCPSC